MTSYIKDLPTGCKPRCRQGVHLEMESRPEKGQTCLTSLMWDPLIVDFWICFYFINKSPCFDRLSDIASKR